MAQETEIKTKRTVESKFETFMRELNERQLKDMGIELEELKNKAKKIENGETLIK